jgi:tetratricopeptide (TPR) repeat protein
MSSAVKDRAAAKPGQGGLYMFSPLVDLTMIAGGLTFLLFPLSLLISPNLNVVAFLVLLFFCNYPHYMATNYRVYRQRSQIERYKIFSIYITGLILLTAVIGHLAADSWIKALYTIYFTWSPFHYTGQNYGIALMYLRRGGTEPSPRERWLLYVGLMSCFAMYLAFINLDSGSVMFPFYSIGIPAEIVRPAWIALLVVALGSSAAFVAGVARRAPARKLLPVFLLVASQFAWFVMTTGIPLFSNRLGLEWLAIGALVPAVAFLHCAQYLGVTAYYAKRDCASEGRAFSIWRYLGVLIVGGALLWVGTARVLSHVFALDYGISFLILLSLINIHHFILDGAIWKLRDGRIARLLLAPEPARVPAAAAARSIGAQRQESGRWRIPAWAVAALLALGLEATDLYYRFGILQANEISRTGDLNRAIELYDSVWNWNPRSSEALNGLAFWDLRRGRLDDAVARWQRSIELNPTETSAYAHIGLGEAYLKLGRVDDAMRHLERAIELRPDEPSSYILLARAYDSRGEGAKAQALRVRASEVVPGVAQQRMFY